jgi:hypothetical protein
MWLQDADDVAEGVFAREDIEAGTFLLDFGELRLATAIESSGQWCGWRLRFDIESKLSTVTKTFVVKDAERSLGDGGGRGMAKGGKVKSTCCRVHKNAELVPDSAGIRMYVRTTRQVRVDSEILVMYQPDRGFFGGVHGRCRCCLCEKLTPECCVEGSDVLHRWAQWGACGAPVFEGSNKLVLIMFTSVTCMFTSVTCMSHL